MSRVRSVKLDRTSAGVSHQEAALQDAANRAFDRVLPDWLQGSKLIENISVSATPGSEYISHGLGRHHRGWWLVRYFGATPIDLVERDPLNAGFRSELADTHLQLAVGDDATISIVIF